MYETFIKLIISNKNVPSHQQSALKSSQKDETKPKALFHGLKFITHPIQRKLNALLANYNCIYTYDMDLIEEIPS